MTEIAKPKNVDVAALTDKQRAELRNSLLAKRRELVAELTQRTHDLGATEGAEAELMDQAETAIAFDDRAQRSTRESALLDAIEAALRRFDDNSYGISEESGEPIGYDRLRAVPWARRTAREEEALERR
jgi:DnaK suppressor protein